MASSDTRLVVDLATGEERVVKLTKDERAAKREAEAGEYVERAEAFRAERDRRLSASDWTQMPDAPLTDAARERWRAYRQELRDLPASADPRAPEWPSEPR